ncbi:hypothetical protein PWO51_01165 [Streptococcus suis]|nr:hypothetical protein [Streptococcus suis]
MQNLSKIKLPIQIDLTQFSKLKLSFISAKPWFEYTNKVKNTLPSGTSVSVVVVEDNIDIEGYEANSNEFEKLTIKIRDNFDSVNFKHRDIVIPYDFEKATIYGDINDKLSIICKLATESEYKQMMANKATQTTTHRQPLPKRD